MAYRKAEAVEFRDDAGALVAAGATFHKISRWRSTPRLLRLLPSYKSIEDIVGASSGICDLKWRASLAADSPSTVLLEGESGTGKELVAQVIHRAGQRANGPFVAVNCGALPEALVESELYGYEEGSFTGAKRGGHAGKFEMAHGGTIFLDEIGDMPLSAQVKLLRVIQERTVTRIGASHERKIDIRIIAATHMDLKQEVKECRFREDLYYRLNVLNLRIPPLRQRREDIPALAQRLSQRIARRMRIEPKQLDETLLEKLMAHDWPGNVRELENMIERAMNLAGDDPVLRARHLELETGDREIGNSAPSDAEIRTDPSQFCEGAKDGLVKPLAVVEKEMICKAVSVHRRNMHRAALSLGISRNTLYRKMKEYGFRASGELA